MRKKGLAAALAMLTLATTGTAFAANYWVPVYYSTEGYNASIAVKSAWKNSAYIKQTGSNHDERRTNYIVTDTNTGIQLTSTSLNISNGDRSAHYLEYGATYKGFKGNCTLRVNSGTTAANYTVWGEWNPNG